MKITIKKKHKDREPVWRGKDGKRVYWVIPFLKLLADNGNVKETIEIVNAAYEAKGSPVRVTYAAFCKLRLRNTDFKEMVEEAMEMSIQLLEDEAHRRAYKGVERPVFQRGEVAGYVTDYSDMLLKLLLQSRRPEVYADKARSGYAGQKPQSIQIIEVRREQPQEVVDGTPDKALPIPEGVIVKADNETV